MRHSLPFALRRDAAASINSRKLNFISCLAIAFSSSILRRPLLKSSKGRIRYDKVVIPERRCQGRQGSQIAFNHFNAVFEAIEKDIFTRKSEKVVLNFKKVYDVPGIFLCKQYSNNAGTGAEIRDTRLLL